MSFLTKYLHQPATLERAKRDVTDKVLLNKFGEIDYESGLRILCRKELHMKDVQTSTGSVVRSETTYIVDCNTPVNVDDKLDGHVVLGVAEYVMSRGQVQGWRCYV